ncbi:hypothetical protein [Mannheimia haemolytica]|uniref:hypothetical protein n=1 Tax=Mannheimia haemolytica TaxID=75985 RepID=UPI002ECE58C2|nr:hypothetical protein [Mannheimia haemolytica]
MIKSKADTLALMFTRDILTTATNTQADQMSIINEYSAKEIATFIKTLSSELESLDEHTDTIRILGLYKSESK